MNQQEFLLVSGPLALAFSRWEHHSNIPDSVRNHSAGSSARESKNGLMAWFGGKACMDKQATIRTIRASYKIDQVENGWTVSTSDGNMFVFADSRELAEWFCMVVGVPMDEKKAKEDPLELEIRKLVKSYNLVAEDIDRHFVTSHVRN